MIGRLLIVILVINWSFVRSILDELYCPKGYFKLSDMKNCHHFLTCDDLVDMAFVQRLGSGAVKDVYLMNWKQLQIAMSVPTNIDMLEDFMNGINTLQALSPSRYIVKYLGFCSEKKTLFTEYHSLGNAAMFFSRIMSKLTLTRSIEFCHQYASILNYIHNRPDGPRVFCDSNSIDKLLSQLLVTNDFNLVLNDVDALPLVVNGSGIKCGHRQLFGTFVAPEQLWHGNVHFDTNLMASYNEKTDIWKAAAVCEHFLKLATGGEILRYRLFDLHAKCRNVNPLERPKSEELMKEYQSVINEYDDHAEL